MTVRNLQWRAAGIGLLRWGLAGVFLYAGVMKLQDAASFATSIARFQMLPELLIHPMALGLPPLEILCGIALLVGPWRRQAALGIAVLCALFLVGLLSAAARGLTVDCSCFGAAVAEPLWRLIARDVLLLGTASILYLHLLDRSLSGRQIASPEMGALNTTSKCLH